MLKEFKTLLPYLRKYLPQYIGGLAFLFITDGGQLLVPQLIRRAIDTLSAGDFALRTIGIIAVEMIGVAVVVSVGRYYWRYFLHGSSRRIEAELRERLFEHLQTLSSTFYGRSKTGDLMARMTNDMMAIRQATGMALVAFIDGFFMTIAILAIMLSHDARLTLLSITPLPFLTAGVILFGRLVGEQFRRVQEGFSELSELTQESFSGVRVLKTFVQEAAFVRRFMARNEEYCRRNMALVRTWGVLFPAVSFLAGVTTLIFLLLGGRAVIEGTISPGEFTAFFAYLQMLIWPMLGAGFTINMLQRAGASLGRINRILEETPDIRDPDASAAAGAPAAPAVAAAAPEKRPRALIRGTVTFRNLSYTYPGTDKEVLSGIDLEVPAGSILGILGRTGSGKSTLVQLLPRVLDPPDGTVLLDGRDVRSYPLAELRRAVAVVPQDNFLFSLPVRENIAFGAEEAPEQALRQAAAVSTIDRDLAAFPQGWDTVIGERGVTLSGGQKQRVAISRALAAGGAVYVMDDSFSSVDTETEDAILRALLPALRGRTLILISHRISTLKTADQVVVLDGGRVAQRGSHAELVGREGYYADIFRLQQLEEAMRKRP